MIASLALGQQAVPSDYRVQPEDQLSITTRDVPEASGQFLVRPDGKITFPLVGEITVAGLTVEEIRLRVTEMLRTELRNPEVTVNLSAMHMARIYAMGAVRSSGVFDWKPRWRITELVAAAGGLAFPPERVKAIVFRPGEPNHVVDMRKIFIDADDQANIELRPSDVVNFQAEISIRVYVVGQVSQQGPVMILEGQGAVEALAAAGGHTAGAELSRAKLVRGGEEIPLQLFDAISRARPELNVPLRDGDTLYVPEMLTRIAVIGSVGRPGPLVPPDGETMTLSQAISMAGGFVREAKTDGVAVARRLPNGEIQTAEYNVRMILRGDPKHPDVPLQHGDVVYVAQSGRTNANQIGGILGVLLTGGRLFPFLPF
jgi:polysaccharide biosynthesis/export protein